MQELRLKWAVDRIITANDQLLPLLEKYQDLEFVEGLAEYLTAVANYVMVADNIRREHED